MATKMLLVLSLLVSLPLPSWSASCPRSCECLWRDSKITADCSHQNLVSVPTSIDTLTQTLNVSYNRLGVLESAIFYRLGLVHLQRVAAVAAHIERIEAGALRGLDNLVDLDLSENVLHEVPSIALNSDGRSLMSVSLRANVIDSLSSKAFFRLLNLRRLDLSHNRITSVARGAFEGLEKLQRVYLHSNLLATLAANELPPALFGISLHDNRWHCDCSLSGLRVWLRDSNVPLSSSPSCWSPRRLRRLPMASLALSEFACAPRISPTSLYLSVAEGKNVSLVCRVQAQPVARVHWLFNGHDVSGQQANLLLPPPPSSSSEPYWRVVSATPSMSSSVPMVGELQVVRHDRVGQLEVQSELVVEQIRRGQNGTFSCVAENKAGSAVANFSIKVEAVDNSNAVLKLQLEHLAVLALAVVLFLVFLLIVLALLLFRTCHVAGGDKKREEDSWNRSKLTVATMGNQASKMPKHIQMGKGFKVCPMTTTNMITTMTTTMTTANSATPMSSLTALNTTSTSAGSSERPDLVAHTSTLNSSDGGSAIDNDLNNASTAYQRAMEHIIDDYKRRTLSMPKCSSSMHHLGNCGPMSLGRYNLTPYYPHDFGLPRSTSTWTRSGVWPRSNPPMSLDPLALWQLEQQQRQQLYVPQKGAYPAVMPDQKYPDSSRGFMHSLPPNVANGTHMFNHNVGTKKPDNSGNNSQRVRVDYNASTSSVGNMATPTSVESEVSNEHVVSNAPNVETAEVAYVRLEAPRRAQLRKVEGVPVEDRLQGDVASQQHEEHLHSKEPEEETRKDSMKQKKDKAQEQSAKEELETKELASPPALESVASWSGMEEEEEGMTSSLMLTSPDTADVSPIKETNDDVYRELEEAFLSLDVET